MAEVPPGYVSLPDAARSLGVTPAALKARVRKGSLEKLRIGGRDYLKKEDVESLTVRSGVRHFGEGGDESIVGSRFGRLSVVEFAGRDGKSDMLYRCRCDCGKEVVVRRRGLLSGDITSCGCARLDAAKRKADAINAADKVEGTSLQAISHGVRSNSATGVTGVSFDKRRGRFEAYINFKKHKTHIGYYDTVEEAAKARREAEKELFEPVLEKYRQKSTEEGS